MTTPLKRKHVVFDEDVAAAGPSTGSSSGQVRSASLNGGVPSRPGQVASKPSGKSEKKKKYLVKKAKRQRKLRAAKKASTPKNREWTGAEGTADGEERENSDDEDDRSESEEEVEAEVQAEPSRGANTGSGATLVEETAEEARARRTREKREKREQRTERKARRAAARAARMVKAAAAPSVPENDEDDDEDDANSDSSSEANADPIDPAGDVFDDELLDDSPLDGSPLDDSPLALVDPSARISLSPSPPPLQAFPLPRAAPAPDPEILSRQGLPAGLESAEFIDQDLRLKLDDLVVQGAQGVSERMRKRLETIGVEDFFAVQAAMLPILLSQQLVPPPFVPLHDYLVSAPTGSGKTLAYAIPLIEVLSKRNVKRLRALIVLPTRDLVVQVRETIEALAKGTGLVIGSATGQHSFAHEQAVLVDDLETRLVGGSSKVDILIATPGRLMDHLTSTPNFTLQHLRFLVIDEADRLLNQSFQNWLAQVIAHIQPPLNPTPPSTFEPDDFLAQAWMEAYGLSKRHPELRDLDQVTCQKLLFSATLTRDPAKVAALSLRNPRYFIVQSASTAPSAVSIGEHFAIPSGLSENMLILPPALKPLNLIHLIHSTSFNVRSALVFTKSVESVARLVKLLEFFEDAWTGDKVVVRSYTREMKPGERKRLLEDFAKGLVNVLVCSDLIARGIDLPSVEHVVSYDIPLDMRKYVHRVGRTARAGRDGTAWTLVEKQEALHFKGVLKGAGHEKKVKKVKVREEDLAPYKQSYEIAMKRLREFFGRGH